MGNTRSISPDEEVEDLWWTNHRRNSNESNKKFSASQNLHIRSANDEETGVSKLSDAHKEQLNEFKLELARKHEKRRHIIAEKHKEMEDLREEIARLQKENQQLKEHSSATKSIFTEESALEAERLRKENEELKCVLAEKSKLLQTSESIMDKNRELRISVAEMQIELQKLNTEVINFEKERQDYQAHVVALKDVISVSKHMLQIRETQLRELKQKVESIEESLAGREMNILSQDLRNEYERQLQNIRNLRALYEERQRVERREKEELLSQLDDTKKDLQAEQNKISELEERIKTLEEDSSKKYDEIKVLESNLGLSKAESRQYQAELTVINQLFSEILLGFNSSREIDLDRLQKHLEDHHDLLQDIVVNEVSSEVSYALPKVLLDLLNQVNTEDAEKKTEDADFVNKLETIEEEPQSQPTTLHQMNSAEEIVENLPKVWRVLIELLSHQKPPTNELTDDEANENACYKTVETPKGPSLVLSVSQTFIRLKDLILEKKSLEKETSHLKQLNGHLENRLQDQEKRLELVQSELSKTWHVVGKLQKQHQMLHTQEKILRYELAQKRKLLNELKEELEYSREKWAQAREKNSTTEQQWKQLRTEFASRRNTIVNDGLNNSVESGYSDDRECSSSDEEPGYETDVSECAQKVSIAEDTGDLPESKETNDPTNDSSIINKVSIAEDIGDLPESKETNDLTNDSSIVNLIQNEIGEIGSSTDNQNEEVPGSSSNEVVHSLLKEMKTDLVQNNDRADITLDSTNQNIPDNDLSVNDSIENRTDGEQPSTSQQGESRRQAFEEMLAKRDERLKRLEGQANQLVMQAASRALKGLVISYKLDNLHQTYGQNSDESENETEEPETDETSIDQAGLNRNNEELNLSELCEETVDISLSNSNEVPSVDLVDQQTNYNVEDNQE